MAPVGTERMLEHLERNRSGGVLGPHPSTIPLFNPSLENAGPCPGHGPPSFARTGAPYSFESGTCRVSESSGLGRKRDTQGCVILPIGQGVEQTALTAYQGGSRPGVSFLTLDIFPSFLNFWSPGRGDSKGLGKGSPSEVAWGDLHRCFSWG